MPPSSDLIIVVTPAALGVGFLAVLALVSAAFLAGCWAMRPTRERDGGQRVECADTVELPRGRGACGGPRTSSLLSGPHLRRDADDTIVIDYMGTGR